MRQAAGNLAFDQLRVYGFADVIGDHIALDCNVAGFGVDAHGSDVHAVGIDHVGRLECGLGAEAVGQRAREIRQPHRRARRVGANDFSIDDVERFRARLHQFGCSAQRTDRAV